MIKCIKKNNSLLKKGFTLIELLVVVLIIGILAAVAVPQYQVAVEKARLARHLPLFKSLLNAQVLYKLQNGTATNDIDLLDVSVNYVTKEKIGEYRMRYILADGSHFSLYSSSDVVVTSFPAGYMLLIIMELLTKVKVFPSMACVIP